MICLAATLASRPYLPAEDAVRTPGSFPVFWVSTDFNDSESWTVGVYDAMCFRSRIVTTPYSEESTAMSIDDSNGEISADNLSHMLVGPDGFIQFSETTGSPSLL